MGSRARCWITTLLPLHSKQTLAPARERERRNLPSHFLLLKGHPIELPHPHPTSGLHSPAPLAAMWEPGPTPSWHTVSEESGWRVRLEKQLVGFSCGSNCGDPIESFSPSCGQGPASSQQSGGRGSCEDLTRQARCM